MKKIGLACDHGGFELKELVKKDLEENGFEIVDYGTNSLESVHYPDYGKKLAEKVKSGEVERGILFCGTGIGISMAAGKVKGIRASVVGDPFSARMAREHNDLHIISLGGRVHGLGLALEICYAFLGAEFEGGRHQTRIDMISEIEVQNE